MFTLTMEVRWFECKPFTDLFKRAAITVDAQRDTEAKVVPVTAKRL
jgi:hypothetical protein